MVKEISEQWSIGTLEFVRGWADAGVACAHDMGTVIVAGVKIAHARFLPVLRSLAEATEQHAEQTKLAIALPISCFVMFGVWVTILFTTGI